MDWHNPEEDDIDNVYFAGLRRKDFCRKASLSPLLNFVLNAA